MASTRSYESSLRAEQAERTRQAIVLAAAALFTRATPEVAMPAVAEEAGVGVATVYRHFPNKDALLDAVYDHWMAGARALLRERPYEDLDQFLALLPELWRRQAEDEELARAMSLLAPAGASVRRRRLRRRRQVATDLVAPYRMKAADRRRLEAVVLLLTSTTAHNHFREHWSMSTDEAAATTAWAIRALLADTQTPSP